MIHGILGQIAQNLHDSLEICQTQNLNLKILPIILKMGKQICTVKPCYILAKRLRLFAMRLPSLSWGNGLLGCGITFDIFTHVLHGSFFLFLFCFFFFFATNVAHLQYKT